MTLLEIKHLKKVYGSKKGVETHALKDINVKVDEGEFVAIMGESGSGKSTLLNIVATFDDPTNGQVLLRGKELSKLKDKDIAKFRRERLGFVFQDFNLLENFNNKDNILLPLVLSAVPVKEMESRLREIAKVLKIEDILQKYPYEISGGQKQRIAIGRGVITNPDILLADEPTGSLDSKSAQMIMDLFQSINEKGQTILMVTHSIRAASSAKIVLFIKDGKVFHEVHRGNQSPKEFMDKISESLSMVNQGVLTYED